MGYGRIASQIGRPKSTIQNFNQRYIERGPHENKQRLGQKKTSKSTEDAVLASYASISKLKLIENIPELQDVHPRTMDRMLRGKGVRQWIAPERKDWTVEQ